MDKGWFVEPTVFVNVDNSMRIAQEEIFGPVLAVIPYDGGDAEAVSIANDSNYGLCGSVYTNDPERGLKVARAVRTGTYMLNTAIPIDFSTPFGGYKESGMGREFGPDGLELFLEKKPSTCRRASALRSELRARGGPSAWCDRLRGAGPSGPGSASAGSPARVVARRDSPRVSGARSEVGVWRESWPWAAVWAERRRRSARPRIARPRRGPTATRAGDRSRRAWP